MHFLQELFQRFSQENGAGSKIKPFEFFKRPYFDRSKFIVLVSSDLRMNCPMADKWTGRSVSSSNPALLLSLSLYIQWPWWALRPVHIKPIILTGCLAYRNKFNSIGSILDKSREKLIGVFINSLFIYLFFSAYQLFYLYQYVNIQ